MSLLELLIGAKMIHKAVTWKKSPPSLGYEHSTLQPKSLCKNCKQQLQCMRVSSPLPALCYLHLLGEQPGKSC